MSFQTDRLETLRTSCVAAVGLAAWMSPGVASACSVCFSGAEETRVAFLLTTIFLTLLPLILIGSLAWWVRRRALEVSRAEAAATARAASPPR